MVTAAAGQGEPIRSAVVRWLTDPLDQHPDARDDLLATVIQRRPLVYISCASFMIMSVSAALLTAHWWATLWLAIDTVLVGYRLYLSFRHDDGRHRPVRGRRAVIVSMLLLFMVFGIGCSLCILHGPPTLMLMAVISVLGVFIGINSRWAAFPRLALATMAVIALPVSLAIAGRVGGGMVLAAVQFVAISAMTCSQTTQNHRTLMRMILAEHRNALLARSDPLTGLGNRMRLHEDLDAQLAGRGRHAARAAVLYLDLDGFKGFNDSHGHDAGDALLHKVGQTLGLIAGDAGIYRIGGDEFVLLCAAADDVALTDLARRITHMVAALRLPDRGSQQRVGASIGIAFIEPDDQSPALLARADRALYAAKRAGKGRCYAAPREGEPQAVAA